MNDFVVQYIMVCMSLLAEIHLSSVVKDLLRKRHLVCDLPMACSTHVKRHNKSQQKHHCLNALQHNHL